MTTNILLALSKLENPVLSDIVTILNDNGYYIFEGMGNIIQSNDYVTLAHSEETGFLAKTVAMDLDTPQKLVQFKREFLEMEEIVVVLNMTLED